MLPLPTLGGHNGQADGINDLGEVAGTAENATADASCPTGQSLHQFKPVTWWRGEIRELRTFPGDPDGVAFGTNDNGDVVGTSGTCAPFNPNTSENITALHALLWQKGAVTDLGNLGGTGSNEGILAFNLNKHDQVVGLSDITGDVSFHAFLWTRQDLGTLHSDDLGSAATGIGESGDVVGLSLDSTGTPHAFIRLNGEKMIGLNTLSLPTLPCFCFKHVRSIPAGSSQAWPMRQAPARPTPFLRSQPAAYPAVRSSRLPNKPGPVNANR